MRLVAALLAAEAHRRVARVPVVVAAVWILRAEALVAGTTDPDARLARSKGKEAKLAYQGHVLMENRHGLVVDALLTQATGYPEREAALVMLEGVLPRSTVGADKAATPTTSCSAAAHSASRRRVSAEPGTPRPEAGHGHATTVRRAPHAARSDRDPRDERGGAGP